MAESDRVLHRLDAAARESEVATQSAAVVVVAAEYVDRRVQGRQELLHTLVFLVGRMVGQVAGDEHRVDGAERANRRDGRGEPRDRVALRPLGADVRVAQLDEEERPAHHARSSASHAARSSSSACTPFVIARVNFTSSWIAFTRSTPAFRSAVASTFPTSRSPWRIGSAK